MSCAGGSRAAQTRGSRSPDLAAILPHHLRGRLARPRLREFREVRERTVHAEVRRRVRVRSDEDTKGLVSDLPAPALREAEKELLLGCELWLPDLPTAIL